MLIQPLTFSLRVLAGNLTDHWLWELVLFMEHFHLLISKVFIIHYVPGTVLGAGHIVVDNTDDGPSLIQFFKYKIDS